MTILIDKKQLDYMRAWVKTYDDGTQILQSYDTDVVERTPDGKYIRLWDSWSMSTSKQVRRWCGESFRDLPFADGTVEKRTRYRTGYDLDGDPIILSYTRVYPKPESIDSNWIYNYYNTAEHKKIKDYVKDRKDLLKLVMLAKACALANKNIRLDKTPEMKNEYDVTAKFYNYDFNKILEAHHSESSKDFNLV